MLPLPEALLNRLYRESDTDAALMQRMQNTQGGSDPHAATGVRHPCGQRLKALEDGLARLESDIRDVKPKRELDNNPRPNPYEHGHRDAANVCYRILPSICKHHMLDRQDAHRNHETWNAPFQAWQKVYV